MNSCWNLEEIFGEFNPILICFQLPPTWHWWRLCLTLAGQDGRTSGDLSISTWLTLYIYSAFTSLWWSIRSPKWSPSCVTSGIPNRTSPPSLWLTSHNSHLPRRTGTELLTSWDLNRSIAKMTNWIIPKVSVLNIMYLWMPSLVCWRMLQNGMIFIRKISSG